MRRAAKRGMMTCRACLIVTLSALAACVPNQAPELAGAATVKANYARLQLIVKFNSTLVPKVNAPFVKRLSRETGVTFVLIRAMAGGAYVVAVAESLSATARESLLHRLRARADVEYVDEDRMLRPALP